MIQEVQIENWDDKDGNPAGGLVTGKGLLIRWQSGPLGRGEECTEPNGCFVETVIAAAMSRLAYYQRGEFACDENEEALYYLTLAVMALECRTADREERGVEGTHEQ